MEIALLVDKTNTFGLRQDANIIREGLKAVDSGSIRIREADPLEPPVPCDVAIHLEVPAYGWMPWCSRQTNPIMQQTALNSTNKM